MGTSLDKELEYYKQSRHRSWAKLIKRLRKQVDDFIEAELFKRGYPNFKLGYMPLMMNVDPEGVTNGELSKRAGITKQGMSKIVAELEDLKYITSEVDPNDARSSIIYLTDKGKRFIIEAKRCMEARMSEYSTLLGKKNFEHLLDMLVKIMEYNESKTEKK